ncbi:hypothetical protein RND81_06G125400 [Saponaria officinalis]|uniref:SWIM-type domain-containing protein n=1 Tax=Saponaria officinalis TaxID=3572 RepID=A0AAW1KAI4_SAPOF
MYALTCGFDVRIYTTKKWRDGTVKSKLLVCNRQGFTYAKKVNQVKEVEEYSGAQDGELIVGDKPRRKTKVRRIGCQAMLRVSGVKGVLVVDRFHAGHNHELVEVKDRLFQKLARRLHKYHKELIVFNSRLKIGATKTFKMCKEHVNNFENIGASLNDFKNFHRGVKCYINEGDEQLFIDRFKNLEDTREDFNFDYEVDVDNSLVRAVWADYSMVFTPFTGVDNHRRSVTFCGALLFRENEESFTWLFRRFLNAMGGKEPHYTITDQDLGIIASVANVFKTARHRFCMWHIMNKVPIKYGSNAKDFPDFLRKLNAIVWDEELEPDEFDNRWAEIMAEHGVGPEREWFLEVFKIRRQWVMSHCRDLGIGGVLRTTQRSESENIEFWMRFESAIDQQRHTQKKLDNDNRHSSPKLLSQLPIEIHEARVYAYELFDDFQKEIIASTSGLSARGFSEKNGVEVTSLKDALRGKVFDIQFDPGTYQVTCTCTMFERCGMLCRHIISIFSSNVVKSIPDCYVARRWCKDAVGRTNENEDVIDVYETDGLLRGRDKEVIESLCCLIRDFRVKLETAREDLTKEQEIEQLLGCQAVDEIKILPPKHAKNKGRKSEDAVSINTTRSSCANSIELLGFF